MGSSAKKSSKKHKIKKELKKSLKKVVNYLKSNSYMYAPLLSPPFLPNNPTFITASGFEETRKEEELGEKKMLRITIDPPDTSSLSSPPIFKFTTGGAQHETATQTQEVKMAEKTSLHLKHRETQQAGAYSSATNTLVRHTLSYRETVKHMIPQNCRSSLVSEFIVNPDGLTEFSQEFSQRFFASFLKILRISIFSDL